MYRIEVLSGRVAHETSVPELQHFESYISKCNPPSSKTIQFEIVSLGRTLPCNVRHRNLVPSLPRTVPKNMPSIVMNHLIAAYDNERCYLTWRHRSSLPL